MSDIQVEEGKYYFRSDGVVLLATTKHNTSVKYRGIILGVTCTGRNHYITDCYAKYKITLSPIRLKDILFGYSDMAKSVHKQFFRLALRQLLKEIS